jgi:hypothetical protein
MEASTFSIEALGKFTGSNTTEELLILATSLKAVYSLENIQLLKMLRESIVLQ